MRITKQHIFAIILGFAFYASASIADVVKIGVLSQQDFHVSMKKWQKVADYLQSQQPGQHFQVLPYRQQADVAVELAKGKLDFVLANKEQIQQLAVEHELVPILKNSKSTMIMTYTNVASYPVAYKVTNQLLQANKLAGAWELQESGKEVVSLELQTSKLLHNGKLVLTEVYQSYGNIILAVLISLLLFLGIHKWNTYQQRIKLLAERKKQTATQFVDTVF